MERQTRICNIVLALAALVVAGTSAAPSQAASCEFAIPRNVMVNLQRLDGSVFYDNGRTRADLAQMHKRSGRASAFGSAWTPVGLTLTDLKYRMQVKVEAIHLGRGDYCARLTGVDANFGYARFSVFVAKRFPPGSCPYESITEHERRHVAVFRQTLDTYFPRMKHRLERAAYALTPVHAASPDAAADLLQTRLRASVDPLFHEMNRTLDRNNAKLDTPEQYMHEQKRCPHW